MPSFSENFSRVSLRLMGLDAGVQLFGHFLNSCCHMWPLLWTGELQARIAFLFLSELCRVSPLTRTGQTPRAAVMTATRLSPVRNHPFPSQTHGEGNDESPFTASLSLRSSRSLMCVFLSACSCAQRVAPACVPVTFLTSSAFSSTYCIAVFPCIGAVYITKNVSQMLKCMKSDLFFSKKPPT